MGAWGRRSVVALIVLSPVTLSGGQAVASSRAAVVLTAKGRGVQVTASIPTKSYAPNSLIAVRVTIKNNNRREIFLPGFPQYCNTYNPSVLVSDYSGKALYPPPIPTLVPPPCGEGGPTLGPKQVITTTQYAIARGRDLRVSFEFDVLDRSSNRVRTTLLTHSIRLRFVPRPAATITLHPAPSGVYATVQKPKGARGPLLYAADDDCPLDQPSIRGAVILAWATSRTPRITAQCPFPPHWVAVAGWVNYPVAQVNYAAP